MADFDFTDSSVLGGVFVQKLLDNPLMKMGSNAAFGSAFGSNSIFHSNAFGEYVDDFQETRNDLNKLSKSLAKNFGEESFVFNYEDYETAAYPSLLSISDISNELDEFLNPQDYLHQFGYINDDGKERSGIFFPVKLNKRIGFIEKELGYRVKLVPNSVSTEFTVSLYYRDTEKFRTYKESEEDERRYNIDDRFRAIKITSPDPTAYIAFVESFTSGTFIRQKVEEEFNKIYKDFKGIDDQSLSDRLADLNWYYEKVPNYILFKEKDKNLLYRHLIQLLKYDSEGTFSWFVDTGNAVVKVLRAITQDATGMRFLFEKFARSPSTVKEIYDHLSKEGHSSYHDDDVVPHKTFFASLILAICDNNLDLIFDNEEVGSTMDRRDITFEISQDKRVDSNIVASDTFAFQFDLTQQVGRTFTVPAKSPSGIYDKHERSIDFGDDEQQLWVDEQMHSLHPLAMVNLIVENPSGISIQLVVPAIFVKDAAEQAEWERVMRLVRLATDILVILVSAGTLAAGVGVLWTLISIIDLGLAAGDLVVLEFEEELKQTPEGQAFLEIWNSVYTAGGIVTGAPALGALFVAGAKLLVKLPATAAKLSNQVIMMLKYAVTQAKNFPKLVSGQFLIVSNALKYSGFSGKLAGSLFKLQKEGVLVVKGEAVVEGVVEARYYLVYKDAIIVEVKSIDELKDQIKPFFSGKNGKGRVMVDKLDFVLTFKEISQESLDVLKKMADEALVLTKAERPQACAVLQGGNKAHFNYSVKQKLKAGEFPEDLHPLVKEWLDAIWNSYKKGEIDIPDHHGKCAEVVNISDWLKSVDLKGNFTLKQARNEFSGVYSYAVQIKDNLRKGLTHGSYKKACESCDPLLNYFGIREIKNIK